MNPKDKPTRIRGVSSSVQQAAAFLRDDMTPAETRLWEYLRGQRLGGLRFRAQHPVGRFILDFYCPACKLVIELDGSAHDGQSDQDAARTEWLAAYGCRVLRFTNDQVLTELPVVLSGIQKAACELEDERIEEKKRPLRFKFGGLREEKRPLRPNYGERSTE